jgi:formylglycine-generating enzyme required for sulfatase activity
MKRHKKPVPAPVAVQAPLSPRQDSLNKLYRGLTIAGILAVVVGAAVAGTIYRDFLLDPFGNRKKLLPSGKELVLREPKLNPNTPPGPAPPGMVWVPGGEFYMGCEVENEFGIPLFLDAAEVHMVYVDGFWMDQHEVTNEEFAKFVAATGYVTEAEKRPDRKDFPSEVELKNLKPFSGIFKMPRKEDFKPDLGAMNWWKKAYGACWKHPEGPDSTYKGREKHPVVHICYDDALAYCKWAKKRLPTEAEWEFAARGGLDRKNFTWGDEQKPGGKWMANVWQGEFPFENAKEDGFEGVAPVGSFPPNAYGLHDMAGNVWEWCADWYQPNYYQDSPERNPPGPDSGFDPMQPGVEVRVRRGGSFLCDETYCMRYVVGARDKGDYMASLNHSGFRCVRDAK